MNSNSIAGFRAGTTKNQFPLQAFATATETALVVTTDTGTTAAVVSIPSQSAVVGSNTSLSSNANSAILIGGLGREYGPGLGSDRPYYHTGSFDGRPFRVRIAGFGTAGANAAQSVLVNLYLGSSATLTAGNLLATTGTALATVAGGGFNFEVEAELMWDSASGILSGSQVANIAFGTGSQYTVPKKVANVLTGITLANLSFVASAQFGNAAASSIQVKDFVIDMI